MQLCRLLLFFICFKCFFFFLFTSQLSVQTVIGLKKLNQKRQKRSQVIILYLRNSCPWTNLHSRICIAPDFLCYLNIFCHSNTAFRCHKWFEKLTTGDKKVALLPGICRLPKGLTCRHKPQFQKQQNQKCYFIKRVE